MCYHCFECSIVKKHQTRREARLRIAIIVVPFAVALALQSITVLVIAPFVTVFGLTWLHNRIFTRWQSSDRLINEKH